MFYITSCCSAAECAHRVRMRKLLKCLAFCHLSIVPHPPPSPPLLPLVPQVMLALRDASCTTANWCVADEAKLSEPAYLSAPKRCLLKLAAAAASSGSGGTGAGCGVSRGTAPACAGGTLGVQGGVSGARALGWGLREALDYVGEAVPVPAAGGDASRATSRTMEDLAEFIASLDGAAEAGVAGGEGGGGGGVDEVTADQRVAKWVCRASLPLLRSIALELHLLGLPLAPLPPAGQLPLSSKALCEGGVCACVCVCVCVCVRSRCVPLKPFTHVCADAVGWEEEYARLCGKLGLAPLLQPPPNPMAPAAAYYDEPTLDMAAWGKLGLRDGAMWQNMCSWAAHLARARSGR